MFIVNGPRDVGGGVDEAADQSNEAKVCAERKKKKKEMPEKKKERKKKRTSAPCQVCAYARTS